MILKSRYPDVITEFDETTNIITSNSQYMRIGFSNDGSIDFIDPEGGPFIEIGSKLDNKVIKSITEIGKSYKIEFV